MEGGEPLLLRPEMVARMLGGRSTKHVYDLVRTRQLACVRTPRIMISLDAVRDYIAQRTMPATTDQTEPAVRAEMRADGVTGHNRVVVRCAHCRPLDRPRRQRGR